MKLPKLVDKGSTWYLYVDGKCHGVAPTGDEYEEGVFFYKLLGCSSWCLSCPLDSDPEINDELPAERERDFILEFWRSKQLPTDNKILDFFKVLIERYDVVSFNAELKLLGPKDKYEMPIAWYRYTNTLAAIYKAFISADEVDVIRSCRPKDEWAGIGHAMLMCRDCHKETQPGGDIFINFENKEVMV